MRIRFAAVLAKYTFLERLKTREYVKKYCVPQNCIVT